MALRWTGHIERSSHREIRALVVQEVHLVRNEIAACGTVPNEGIVIPTIPEPAHHIREFDRTVVTLAMFIMLGATEIPGFRLVGGGDHVPAGTPMANVVERRKLACHVVGLVVTGGGGRHQADPLGEGGDR